MRARVVAQLLYNIILYARLDYQLLFGKGAHALPPNSQLDA